VIINSADFTDDNDYSDGGNPCYPHPANPSDDTSPGGGHWTDVKVKERDLNSIFGGIGLPLPKNTARARVDIHPAVSGHRFLPLAVPNNIITKVQVRYYNECTGAEITSARHDLAPLPTGFQGNAGGGQFWGLPDPNDPSGQTGDPAIGFNLDMPAYDPACGDYVPVGMEVRLASRDEIDLNQSCAVLLAARYADCFHRLSQIRVWNDGNPDSQIRIPRIALSGGCGAPADGYFSRLPTAAVNCTVNVAVDVNWGSRSTGTTNVPNNFTVTANGTNLGRDSWVPGGVSTYSGAITAGPGATPVTITAHWEDHTPGHSWPAGTNCTPGSNTPCKDSVNDGHRTFVGTNGTAGAVALARTGGQWNGLNNLPGNPFDNHRSGGGPADCSNTDSCLVYPTVGTVSVLKTGTYVTLRLDDPQANQTLQCDPNVPQGQEFTAFRNGCMPWYGANQWTSPWWIGPTGSQHCPDSSQWFSYSNLGAGFGVNSAGNPFRCVLTAPGMSTGQVGDDIAVATDNCDNINNNSCQTFDCNYDGNYDGKGGTPGWITTGGAGGEFPPNPRKRGSNYPRVVNLFIIPYQGGKGLTGAGDTIPVLGFASFYVMDWGGANTNQNDPCPDTTWGSVNVPRAPAGAITGVFVETVDYEPGPVDPTATCVEGQLTPCRVTLVR
jgi:hypothetical protein